MGATQQQIQTLAQDAASFLNQIVDQLPEGMTVEQWISLVSSNLATAAAQPKQTIPQDILLGLKMGVDIANITGNTSAESITSTLYTLAGDVVNGNGSALWDLVTNLGAMKKAAKALGI